MRGELSRKALALLSCVVMGCAADGASPPGDQTAVGTTGVQTKTNPEAQVLADFKKRIDAYMELHNKLEKEAPPLKETKEPAKIKASQDVLAKKLQAARKDAKQGDIFTPQIRQALRRLMSPEVKGTDGKETKAAITEETHELKGVVLKVNATYPDDAPLMTVPPNILAALPKLPEDLEYRFVSRNMILLDTHANIIVDFVPNAIQ
jgi:hypothetical protein